MDLTVNIGFRLHFHSLGRTKQSIFALVLSLVRVYHQVPRFSQLSWVPKTKKRGDDLYEFTLRMCANGSGQQKGVDYDHSWSPTVGASGFRLTLMFAATHDLTIGTLDAVNCFQSTNRKPSKRLTIHTPPYYMSWFK